MDQLQVGFIVSMKVATSLTTIACEQSMQMNAIIQCAKFGVPTANSEIYVTHFPCLPCSKAIIQAGIKAVYYAKDYKNHPHAIELFDQAGVRMEQVPVDKDIFLSFAVDLLKITRRS